MRAQLFTLLLLTGSLTACSGSPSAPSSDRAIFHWDFGTGSPNYVLSGGEGTFAVPNVPGGAMYEITLRSTLPAVMGRRMVQGFSADALFRGVPKSAQEAHVVKSLEPKLLTSAIGWTYETTCEPGTYALVARIEESGAGMSGVEVRQAVISVTVLPPEPGARCSNQGR
jgi:hypothetical protein